MRRKQDKLAFYKLRVYVDAVGHHVRLGSPSAPPLVKDKSGQGFLRHASLKIAHSPMPPPHERALAIWFIS